MSVLFRHENETKKSNKFILANCLVYIANLAIFLILWKHCVFGWDERFSVSSIFRRTFTLVIPYFWKINSWNAKTTNHTKVFKAPCLFIGFGPEYSNKINQQMKINATENFFEKKNEWIFVAAYFSSVSYSLNG